MNTTTQPRFIILNHQDDTAEYSDEKKWSRRTLFFASIDQYGNINRSEDIEVDDNEGLKKHKDWQIVFYNCFHADQCNFFQKVIARLLDIYPIDKNTPLNVFIHRGGEELKKTTLVKFWPRETVGRKSINRDLGEILAKINAKGIPMSRGSRRDFIWSHAMIFTFDDILQKAKNGECKTDYPSLFEELNSYFSAGFEYYSGK